MADAPSVTAGDYPDPLCRYGTDQHVVTATNDAFLDIFGVGEGIPIGDVIERTSPEGRSDILLNGGSFVCEASGRKFSGRVVPSEEGGIIVFVELPSSFDREQDVGVDDLASVLSHDLRNPLDVAMAHLEAGRDLDDDAHFNQVEQAHERMERIIRDVLTVARGEEVVALSDSVDLDELVMAAWQNVETEDASLETRSSLPTVTADPDRVSRLFENLFRNAIEHGPSDENESVTVTVGRCPSINGFFVEDDGQGIPVEERDNVFEPGYTGEEHGTGLGLAIVARIAEVHGWTIELTSSEEHGARFELGSLALGQET